MPESQPHSLGGEDRPWGRYDVLADQTHFKCKVLRVNPGQRLSYQSHAQREEHWVFVQGEGVVILDDVENRVKKGSYIKIPRQARHRIVNTGSEPLQLIEVQLGDYFGEDDIVRYADDYNRA